MPDDAYSPDTPSHLAGLLSTNSQLRTADGVPIEIWKFTAPSDPSHLSAWAARFRDLYLDPDLVDAAMSGTPSKNKPEFFRTYVLPDTEGFGPATRSGDFAELLVSDMLENWERYYVLKEKYRSKQKPNQSQMGIDVVGLRQERPDASSPEDSLITYEVKARLSSPDDDERLLSAIGDSARANEKLADTLQAEKMRYIKQGRVEDVRRVERFQNQLDRPFTLKFGAAAIILEPALRPSELELIDLRDHPGRSSIRLIVIVGANLMTLVNELFDRAANEA